MPHTPGPWQRRSIPGHLFEIRTAPDKDGKEDMGDIVLRIRGGLMPTLADATLIALAPDMLAIIGELVETLNEALTMLPHIDRNELTALNKANALLDRAKG